MKFRAEKMFVAKPFLPPKKEFDAYLDMIWESNWLTNNGPIHRQFEHRLHEYLKVQNISLFTNGHLALETAIQTLDLSGEVITTPFTFASTIHAIVRAGLTPVFCDIDPNTFNMDVEKLEPMITERTSAIIPVHVFGTPCDVDGIEKIARQYKLKVIYDAAHAFGVEINGRGIGSYGDVSMFSLHATKVFHSIEGGVLTTNDSHYRVQFDRYKNFGILDEEHVESVGLNAKMNEFQAAMGMINLNYIEDHIERRRRITEEYRRLLSTIPEIWFPAESSNIKYNYSYFPIVVSPSNSSGVNRNVLYERLKDYNIFTRKYFYPLCTDFECYKYDSERLVNARYVSDNVLTLPIYSDLELSDVRYVCEAIKDIVG